MNRIRSCDHPAKGWIRWSRHSQSPAIVDSLLVDRGWRQMFDSDLCIRTQMECLPLRLPNHCRGAHSWYSTKPVSRQHWLKIRIQLHRHHGKWRFHVKIINGTFNRVFDGHWTCIPVNQLKWQCIHPISPQHGRYFMAESLVIWMKMDWSKQAAAKKMEVTHLEINILEHHRINRKHLSRILRLPVAWQEWVLV